MSKSDNYSGHAEDNTPRGSVEDSTEPRFLVIGQVLKAHGVRGEVRVNPVTELPERFNWLDVVYLGEVDPKPVGVEAVRYHKGLILLKLVGFDDRDAAQTLRGTWLQVPEDEAIPLENGEYYLYQLIDLAVFTENGQHLGILVDVIETGANNVFVVQGEEGEKLLPDIDDVVQDIDFENGRLVVRLLPGL